VVKLPPLVTQLSDVIETQFLCQPLCLGRVNFSMAPSETLSDKTGSEKSKMMTEKNDIKRSSVSTR